tara:strand:- start:1775 stop:3652 length:1878 start_codon:yes stop_codon:yes gene_type:complete
MSFAFGQISLSDAKKLSNLQLDAIRDDLQSQAATSIVKQSENAVNASPVSITSQAVSLVTDDLFGYSYFKKDISFYDNIPTPSNYKLGPGDEILISLWGETNFQNRFTIDKQGLIYFENIGFINLSNNSIEAAEKILQDKLSKIYSTLQNDENSTQLMLSLGRLKSLNIYFSGYIENPGINLVHPFSDIFTAIVQAGGISQDGSLRNVQLIRNNNLISSFDFYSFFIDGKINFSDIKLLDGDVIHIPKVERRVSVDGEVIRPSSFELLPEDSIDDVFKYAAGLTSSASSNVILNQIIPIDQRLSNDNARKSQVVNLNDLNSIELNDGDRISIGKIANVSSDVEVFGRVKSAGSYPANGLSLKNLLDLAGGFNDPIFRKSIDENILILRKDENQFYGLQFNVSYDSSDKFELTSGDKVFVYNNSNYDNIFTYFVSGEINRPGTYPLKKGTTVKDVIDIAGGVTAFGSLSGISASIDFSSFDENGNEVVVRNNIGNLSLDYEIGKNTTITLLPLENVVNVTGNVYKPGLINIDKSSISFSKVVELAGGYQRKSLKRRSYVTRKNGEIDKVGFFPGMTRVYKGDTVFIPSNPKQRDFDITTFSSVTAELVTTLTNIAAIFIILDNDNN